MFEKKQIIFSFDYELFLGGKSGTVHNCLIFPTKKIIEVLKKFNAKGVFFVDTTYLHRLKQLSYPASRADYIIICEQIRTMINDGHYVFPHLHPHWLDAIYDYKSNQWSLNNLNKYRFHNLSIRERDILFDSSIKILEEIIKPLNCSYEINGYRAGGWSIQPFEDFAPYFIKYGIKYDFSVLPGAKLFSTAQHYDYLNIPLKPIYRFSKDIIVEDIHGYCTEFSISKIKINKIISILNKVFVKLNPVKNNSLGDGFSVKFNSENEVAINDYRMVAMELLTIVKIPTYMDYLSENNYMHFISHPKMISWLNLTAFNNFLERSFKLYSIETDFKKMI